VNNTSLLDAALEYANRGWRVFPCVPEGKTPLTRNGFKAATTDLGIIESWWDWTPHANIGLATGHIFDVLDVDGDAGVKALRKFWLERGIDYRHEGPVSLTGRGWHFLFAATGFRNGAALLGPDSKLDFRGAGGYIIAAPSKHPLGHHYQWDDARGPDRPLPVAPDWLTPLMERSGAPEAQPAKPKPVILANETYEALIEGGLIPRDQIPRGVQSRLEREDILAVCAELGFPLRQRGHYYLGKCPTPEHEDSTPSCAFYPSNNTWYCYGCQAHGDSLDLRNGTHL
jgi:putative DNA primase/helicase